VTLITDGYILCYRRFLFHSKYCYFLFIILYLFVSELNLLNTLIHFSDMGREILIGDTVLIHGGKHRGKRAIVLDVTPKMVYIQLKCSGARTRIMSYNVILLTESPKSGIVKEIRSMQESVLNLPNLLKNDGTTTEINYEEAVIKENRQISDSVDKVATLLQAIHLLFSITILHKY
jgi:ribosomal protein L24